MEATPSHTIITRLKAIHHRAAFTRQLSTSAPAPVTHVAKPKGGKKSFGALTLKKSIENSSLCTFFIRRSFPCRAPSRRSPSGPPHALDHPGDGSDDRAEDGTGHKTAEERGDAKNDGLQAGIEHTFEVAAESRRATVERRRPKQLV